MNQFVAILLDTIDKRIEFKSIIVMSIEQAEIIAETLDDERYLLLEVAQRDEITGNLIISIELMAKLPELV